MFLTYGAYGGSNFYSYDIAANSWSMLMFAFNYIEDGGITVCFWQWLAAAGSFSTQSRVRMPRASTFIVFDYPSVATSVGSSKVTAGYPALLSSTITNGGPGNGPVQFTDNVPGGLD